MREKEREGEGDRERKGEREGGRERKRGERDVIPCAFIGRTRLSNINFYNKPSVKISLLFLFRLSCHSCILHFVSQAILYHRSVFQLVGGATTTLSACRSVRIGFVSVFGTILIGQKFAST